MSGKSGGAKGVAAPAVVYTARQRAKEALRLRVEGVPVPEIQARLHFKSRQGVHQACNRELARVAAPEAKAWLAMQLARCDALSQSAVLGGALTGTSARWARVYLYNEMYRSRLVGLLKQDASTVLAPMILHVSGEAAEAFAAPPEEPKPPALAS